MLLVDSFNTLNQYTFNYCNKTDGYISEPSLLSSAGEQIDIFVCGRKTL